MPLKLFLISAVLISLALISFPFFTSQAWGTDHKIFKVELLLIKNRILLNTPCNQTIDKIHNDLSALELQDWTIRDYIDKKTNTYYITVKKNSWSLTQLFTDLFREDHPTLLFKNYHLCESNQSCPPGSLFLGMNSELRPICQEQALTLDRVDQTFFCGTRTKSLSLKDLFPKAFILKKSQTQTEEIGCSQRPFTDCQNCSCGVSSDKYCQTTCPAGTTFMGKNPETGLANCFEYDDAPPSKAKCQPTTFDLLPPTVSGPENMEWPCEGKYLEPERPHFILSKPRQETDSDEELP